ncbi:MAG: hypothetical protein AB7I37_23115 [Pirellulales bacterium]
MKFVAMLNDNALYFSRADKQEDDWEGVVPKHLLDEMEQLPKPVWLQGKSYAEHFRKIEISRHYLNCWHLSQNECAAMWSIYGERQASIAVRSTVGRFKRSFGPCNVRETGGQSDIVVGNVSYGNHTAWQPSGDSSGDVYAVSFFIKRPSYSFEREFRAKIDGSDFPSPFPVWEGINVTVDLRMLLQSIYVAPRSPDWFKKLVKDVLVKFDFSAVEVIRSELDFPAYM